MLCSEISRQASCYLALSEGFQVDANCALQYKGAYGPEAMREWAQRVQSWRVGGREVYMVFNNTDNGQPISAIADCRWSPLANLHCKTLTLNPEPESQTYCTRGWLA